MNNPQDKFTEALIVAMGASYKSYGKSDVELSVSRCSPKFGDFSTNVAFRLAKDEGISPEVAAAPIVAALSSCKDIVSAEYLPPGFINATLKQEIWVDYLASIGKDFGFSKKGHGSKIQLEFISANPTGPLVLTNAWQGYYGDILSNIFSSQGYLVSREYYLNDGGNQIVSLGRAVQQSLGKNFSEEIASELYRGEYISIIADIITTEIGSPDLVTTAEPSQIGLKAAKLILEQYIKPDLARLGVKFDSIYSEGRPDIQKTLNRLEDAGLSKHKDGALWLDGSKVGLKQDEVLVRSYDDGHSYFLKDIAYQLERLEERGFNETITIVGPDHHGQSIRLLNTLKALGHSGFSELSTQTIRLIRAGKEFKMSKRKGNYVLLDDFLDTVPTEAARFYFAMRDTNTHMDFDIDLISQHSSKNPVYYSLYAYARACSIEEKAQKEGVEVATSLKGYSLTDCEKHIAVELSKLPEILLEITSSHKVHQLLHHTVEIAKSFHEYYEQDRVLSSTKAAQKLFIIARFKRAYESIFSILGVDLLEKM